jgi:hypothetical protein
MIALGSAALFVATFASADFAESVNRALSKTEDPFTGKPLRMLWWFRWFTAMLGLFLFVGLSDYASPPAPPTAGSGGAEANSAPVAAATEQQILDARLALCVATADELETVRLGKPHKDAIILANQFFVGEKAGGRAIGREWFAYKDGEWHDSDCRSLSTASWAIGQGYAGDPIDLPDGAIAEVVNSGGWTPPK